MSSGETTLPRDFDIFAPSLITMPCVNSRAPAHRSRSAQIAHHLGPEARVDQVQNRVLHAANVLVDRKPVLRNLRENGALEFFASV
jgi:hypothetical protein